MRKWISSIHLQTSKNNWNLRKGGIKQEYRSSLCAKRKLKNQCYHCGEEDHIANVCPKKGKGKEEAHVHTQVGATLNESDEDEEELGYVHHQNSNGLV